MPRTGAPPMIGDTPTTGAPPRTSASRSSVTARIGAIDTTGLLGATSTTSASASASSTPGAGLAASAPTKTNRSAGSSARYRIHHSWKCSARPPVTTWVSTRSSVAGSSRTPGRHRAHSASVTADSGYPASSIRVRISWVATSLSPRPNQVGSAPYAASSSLTTQVSPARPQPRSASAPAASPATPSKDPVSITAPFREWGALLLVVVTAVLLFLALINLLVSDTALAFGVRAGAAFGSFAGLTTVLLPLLGVILATHI